MKRGTASRVILGKNTIVEMPGGVFVGTDVILGKKDGLTNDFNGLVLSNTVMFGKKVSHAAIISVIVRGANRIVLPDAIANSLSYVKAFGGTEQNGTPTPDTPVDIISNNGVIKVNSQGQIYTDGTVETISVHGKNWFDENDVILGYFYNDSGTYTSNNVTYTSGKILMNAGTTVTFSRGFAVAGVYLRIHAFDSNDNWIGLVAKSPLSTDLRCTGTTPANTSYIRVCGAKKAAPSTKIDHECQVELGSTATTYAPYYDGGTATAEMLLKVGDYQDEQDIPAGVVTRNVGIKVLDGTENFETATATNCYSLTNTLGTGNFSDRTIMCSHFANTPTMPDIGDRQGFAFIANKGLEYTIAFGATTQFSTQALWKQFLADQYAAGTPVIVVYPLATPTTESVAGQTLQVTDGDNTLEITQASLDNLELEAQYNTLVQLTVQEVENANLDNDVTVTIQ